MHRAPLSRVLTALALVVPSAGTLGFAGSVGSAAPASAATNRDTCSQLVASATALTGKLKGCPADTGGSGKLSNFLPGGGHIAWHNGTATRFATTSQAESDPDGSFTCPAKQNEFELKGTVTKSTNHSIAPGAAVHMEVCVDQTSGTITNEPNTLVKFSS